MVRASLDPPHKSLGTRLGKGKPELLLLFTVLHQPKLHCVQCKYSNRSKRRNKIASILTRHAKTLIGNLDAFVVALHSFAGYI